MNLAITDRSGPDTSPLTLNVERGAAETASAILGRPVPPHFPNLGTLVCAHGPGGWRYIGPVISVDMDAGTYAILPVAANPIADKIKELGLGSSSPRKE